METNNIKAIIFDLDGTLYFLKYMQIRMSFRLWRSIGILKKLFTSLDIIREEKFSNQEQLLTKLYSVLSQKTGKSVQYIQHWYQNIFMLSFISMLSSSAKARKNLNQTLINLKKDNIYLAVVSDFSHVEERLNAIGINPEHFDEIKCSEQFGVLKPSPEPMTALADKWNVQYNQVCIVGDRDDRDGDCAKNAKMQFIGINNKKNNKPGFYSWDKALDVIINKINLENNL